MGMNLSVHIGPFVNVPVVSVIDRKRDYGCANPACAKRTTSLSDRFCSHCGQPHTQRETEHTVQRPLRLDDLEGNFVDELHEHQFDAGRRVWMPNHAGLGVRIDECSDSQIISLSPTQAAEECERFRLRYARVLEAVKIQYGIELLVEYGAVSYYA